ncbi:MAG: phosphatidylserine/phosphatidylglycerophosphate/cardiolipin synthase family protein, partial [Polyangiaceae bacterium]
MRHLRDGTSAFPAMLAAIACAKKEVLLEMYWIGADRVGRQFRDALAERAKQGVSVFVLYDFIGSFETGSHFWQLAIDAGVIVRQFSPISPFSHGFRPRHIFNRDHRKMLIVDESCGFAGGINIGEAWAPPDAPQDAWRDDAIEVHGEPAQMLRAAFLDVWQKLSGIPAAAITLRPIQPSRVRVLTNTIEPRPNRAIRRAYLRAIRQATKSIDIANAYFLPGPLFLYAIRQAARKGVRVRILVPEHSDVFVAGLAMSSLYGRLLTDGAEVFAYLPRILHSKTAIFDGRLTMIGSHNLDALSWRFDLECDIAVDSEELAKLVHDSFERDLTESRQLDLNVWRSRHWSLRLLAWLAALFR